MRLFSGKKIGKFKFILFGLGFFVVSFPALSVYADTVGPTITVGSENSYTKGDSPGLSNIFKITSPEENRILLGCPISTVDGIAGNFIKAVETVVYTRFDSTIREIECPTSRTDISATPSNNSGILGILNVATGSVLQQRPASGVQFAEEKIYAITNPGKVYAQDPASYFPGTGFDLLQPIRSFWGWSVNLVFGILIVIILFVAFAIILGDRMPGNMKVTLQSAIPNIALAMILVPLSYAISGLFIDFITIGSNAVHDFVLGPASPGYGVYLDREQGPNDRGLYIDDQRLTWIDARSQVDVRQEVEAISDSGGINGNVVFQLVASILNVFATEEQSNVGTNPSSASAWLGSIVNAILSLLMIWIGIKILIRLFKKYLSLIIMPIFSPFVFATVAVPGNGTKPIVTYAKSLAASSLGFIVTYLMFLLTIVFSNTAFQASVPDFRTGLWVPPLLGISQLEELAGAGGGLGIVPFLLGLISIGIYFSIPKVLDQIDDALGAKFSLPEFVRTPFESFRESARVTGGFAFRTVPTTGARLVNIGRNLPEASRRAVSALNLSQRIKVGQERRAGFTPNTPGGTEYALKQKLDDDWAGAKRRQDEAKNRVVAADKIINSKSSTPSEINAAKKDRNNALIDAENASNEMKRIDRIAATQPNGPIALSHSEKPEERSKLSVKFISNFDQAQDSINFTTSIVNQLNQGIEKVRGGWPVGKLVFEIGGNGLPFSIGRGQEIEIGRPKTIGLSDEQNFDPDQPVMSLSSMGDMRLDLFKFDAVGDFNGHLKLIIDRKGGLDSTPYVIKNDGKTIEVKLLLVIDQVEYNSDDPAESKARSLFGTRVERDKLPIGWMNGSLVAGAATPTSPDVIFRIAGRPNERTGGYKMFIKATW